MVKSSQKRGAGGKGKGKMAGRAPASPKDADAESPKPSRKSPKKEDSVVRRYGIDAALVLTGVLHALLVSLFISPTYDEGKHIINGIAYLANNECCLSEESPGSGLHALFLDKNEMTLPPLDREVSPPQGTVLFFQNKGIADKILFTSRISSILMYGVLLVVIGLWLRRTTSVRVSRIGIFIGVFCPTLLAYASVATTDIHMTALIFLSLYLLLRFSQGPSLRKTLVIGAVCGLTLLTKFSALIFFTAYCLAFIALSAVAVVREKNHRKKVAFRYLGYLTTLVLVSVFILNLGYFFKGTFSTLKDIDLKSDRMSAMRESWMGEIPLPLPAGMIRTIDYSRRMAESEVRKKVNPGMLFGKPYPNGSRRYYLAALALKTSTVLLVLLLLGSVFYVRQKRRSEEYLSLLFCPLFLLFFISAFDVFNKGVRYVLVMLPLMIIVAAHAFAWARSKYLILLLPLLALSTVWCFPNYLSFFNASSLFCAKEDMLVDSNLDWGQMDHLVVDDVKTHSVTNVCPRLLQPNGGKRLGLNACKSRYPRQCTYYVSKAEKQRKFFEPLHKLMRSPSPDRVLGDTIEVFEVTSEKDFVNKFVNRWAISDPFDARGISSGRFLSLLNSQRYVDVSTTFGHVDVGALFPKEDLRNKCVIAKSKDTASGELLFAARGKMAFIDGISGERKAASKPSRVLSFYRETMALPDKQTVTALVCATDKRVEFSVGYVEDAEALSDL